MKLEHIHITVNAVIDPSFKALPKDDAQRFVDKLMKTVKMKPLGPLNWSDAEDLAFPGQSLIQMITTSHTSLHLFTHADGTNEIYFDLYSCTHFDEEKVVKLLDDTFGLVDWHGVVYQRATGAKPSVKLIGNKAKEMLIAKPMMASYRN